MKRYIYVLCVVLSSMLLYTSCLGSNDSTEITVYDDMAITGFSLATVNRYLHTTTKSGKDSIYKKVMTVRPTFTIDQTQYKIYNTDSLPKDCDLKHVLVSISSSTYSGAIFIKSVVGDTLYTYNSTDSIDFSHVREIRVFNNTLQKYRSYEVKVNQHQVETNKILWEEASSEDYPVSDSRQEWEKKAADAGLGDFIGTGRQEAYAFSKDRTKIMVSKDEGTTWTPDSIDGDLSLLPKGTFAFVSYPFAPNENTDYQILAGEPEDGEIACWVWRKIAEYSEGSMVSKWVNIPLEPYNRFFLPVSQNFSLVHFHGYVLAIDPTGIHYSRDGGITWLTSDNFKLPEDDAFNVEAVTDADGVLWFKDLDTDEVWRGVLIE